MGQRYRYRHVEVDMDIVDIDRYFDCLKGGSRFRYC